MQHNYQVFIHILALQDLERKPDYEKKQQEELVKIEERCVLVMEIMNQVDASETISDSGAIQVLSALVCFIVIGLLGVDIRHQKRPIEADQVD